MACCSPAGGVGRVFCPVSVCLVVVDFPKGRELLWSRGAVTSQAKRGTLKGSRGEFVVHRWKSESEKVDFDGEKGGKRLNDSLDSLEGPDCPAPLVTDANKRDSKSDPSWIHADGTDQNQTAAICWYGTVQSSRPARQVRSGQVRYLTVCCPSNCQLGR